MVLKNHLLELALESSSQPDPILKRIDECLRVGITGNPDPMVVTPQEPVLRHFEMNEAYLNLGKNSSFDTSVRARLPTTQGS